MIYIKFKHPDDVYAINSFYQTPLPPGEPERPRICGRCGDTLYIPVELPEEVSIIQPRGGLYKPFPVKSPYLVSMSEPNFITLSFSKKLNISEIQRLKSFIGMAYVGEDGFEMYIDGISAEPVRHKCEDLL